jgi:hypothetical protein
MPAHDDFVNQSVSFSQKPLRRKRDQLVDEIRELTARAYGKGIELAMLAGDRATAEIYQREMFCQIKARRAAACLREPGKTGRRRTP